MLTTRSELINAIQADSNMPELSKEMIDRVLKTFLVVIQGQLRKGETVSISDFGTFSVGERAGRTGRNPRTGELVEVPPKRVAKFKIATYLKTAPEVGRQIEEKIKQARAVKRLQSVAKPTPKVAAKRPVVASKKKPAQRSV